MVHAYSMNDLYETSHIIYSTATTETYRFIVALNHVLSFCAECAVFCGGMLTVLSHSITGPENHMKL